MKKSFLWLLPLIMIFAGCSTPSPTAVPAAMQSTLKPTQNAGNPPTSTPEPEPRATEDLSSLPVITLDNIEQLKVIKRLGGYEETLGIVFSPDGEMLASFGLDGVIRLWELSTGFEIISLSLSKPAMVMALDFNPESTFIAAGYSDKAVRLWNLQTGVEQAVFEGHTEGIAPKALAWSPDGSFIAAGSLSSSIKIWDADTGKELAALNDHNDDINGINFNQDGSLFASASNDNLIYIWDMATFSKKEVLAGHQANIGDVVFSPDSSMVSSISGDILNKDNSVYIWDLETGKPVHQVEGHSMNLFSDLSLSPDGSILLSTGGVQNDDTVRVYDFYMGEFIGTLDGGMGGYISVAFSPDGRLVATNGTDGVIEIWGVD